MAIITIVGSGMMGSAIGIPASENGHEVRLVGTPLDREIIEHARKTGWHLNTERLGPAWETGYALGRKWWNKGYATEALCAVRDFWFGTAKGQWLTCCHAFENVASAAVMQKAGFTYHHDAVHRRFDGTEVPVRVYFLLRNQVELPR